MLKDKLKDDLKTAMKAGDSVRRTTIGMVLSVLQNREIEKRTKTGTSDLTDEEVISAISTEIKKRKEAIETYEKANRPELAEGEKSELAILMGYMPEQMGEDEVKKLIADAIASTGASGPKDMGKVMGAVSPKIKGRFDGTHASALVKEALGA